MLTNWAMILAGAASSWVASASVQKAAPPHPSAPSSLVSSAPFAVGEAMREAIPEAISEDRADLTVRSSSQGDGGPRLRLGAAAVHMGLLVGLGIGWYEWQIELNKNDFDFPRTFEGQWRRLTTRAGYRFDDNERYLNVGHAGMGAIYYQTARVHGAGVATSYLFALGTSTVWETAVEHREVVSVNDQIVTALGGAPLGEALLRIGDVFARGKPTFVNRLLMSLASPMRLGAWLLGEAPPESSDSWDAAGLDATVGHRFELALGALSGFGGALATPVDRAWTATARADFEVIALPPSGAADGAVSGDSASGEEGAWLHGGEVTRLLVDYAGSDSRFRGFDLHARTTLWGRYARSSFDGPRVARSSTRILGTASAFELAYNVTGGLTDFLSLAHVVGPTADFAWVRGGWSMRAEVTAYGDFAMVRPMAIGVGAGPLDGAKSTLAEHEYYYGWGGTAATRLEVGYQRLRAGAAAEWNHIDSIEGLDRHQSGYVSPTGATHGAIVDDSPLTDDRVKLRLFVELPIPFVERVSLNVAAELVHRSGDWQARALSHVEEDRRLMTTVAYTL